MSPGCRWRLFLNGWCFLVLNLRCWIGFGSFLSDPSCAGWSPPTTALRWPLISKSVSNCCSISVSGTGHPVQTIGNSSDRLINGFWNSVLFLNNLCSEIEFFFGLDRHLLVSEKGFFQLLALLHLAEKVTRHHC